MTSHNEEPAQRCWMSRGENERGKVRGGRDEIKGYGGSGWGEGKKLGSITSLLEQSQEGKDVSRRIDCTSLPRSLLLDEGQASCV